MATQTVFRGEAKTIYMTPIGRDATGFYLTSANVYLYTPIGTTIAKTATVVDVTSGYFSWALTTTEFDTPGVGEYLMQLKIVGASGTIWGPVEYLRVEAPLPTS